MSAGRPIVQEPPIMEPFDFTHFDFINRANAEYIDQLFQRYQQDPRSVESHWRAFFAGFEAGGGRQIISSSGPSAPSGYEDLVHAYRELGHFVANLDPLGHNRPGHPLLELSERSEERRVGKECESREM